jgi:MbtH protein
MEANMFRDFPDNTKYRVVINHEEQYSLWPADKRLPADWRDAGQVGSKAECTTYIEKVWREMRPLELHKEMAEQIRRLG